MNNSKVKNDVVSNDELSDSENEEKVIEESKKIKTKLLITDFHKKLFECVDKLNLLDDELKEINEEYFNKIKNLNNRRKKIKREINMISKKIPKS